VRRISVSAVWLLLLALLSPSALADQPIETGWTRMGEFDGIVNWESKRPSMPLSAFKARTVIRADMWLVLAVLEDVNRAAEWTHHCAEMRLVRRGAERDMFVYARMDAPWPVHDRDVVTRVLVEYGKSGELSVAIHGVSGERPERPGVVRIPYLRAFYHFRALNEEATQVEYEIEIDPGGTLPGWLKTMVSRDFARQTLSALRDRVLWSERNGVYDRRAEQLRDEAERSGFGG
jgi:hypothetical protein